MTSVSSYTTHQVIGTVNGNCMVKVSNNCSNNYLAKDRLPVLWNKTNEGFKGAPSPSPKLPQQSQQRQSSKFSTPFGRNNNNSAAHNNNNHYEYHVGQNSNLHANYFRSNNTSVMNCAGAHNENQDIYRNNVKQFNSCNAAKVTTQSQHKQMTWQHLQKMQTQNNDKYNNLNKQSGLRNRSNNNNSCNKSNNINGQMQTHAQAYVARANMQIKLPQQGTLVNAPKIQRQKQIQKMNPSSMAAQCKPQQTTNVINPHMNTGSNYNTNVIPQINHAPHSPTAIPPEKSASPFVRSHIVMNDNLHVNNSQRSREVSTSPPTLPPPNINMKANYNRSSGEERVNGNNIKKYCRVRPVDRGPQPMCVTPTRLPDGRRVTTEPRRLTLFGRKSVTVLDTNDVDNQNNVMKTTNDEVKKRQYLDETSQPKLKPLPGRRPPRNLTKRKQIKLTVGNDDSWMKGLTNSTWILSPVQSKPLAVPYKRVPNKKRSQKRNKRNENKASHESSQGSAVLHNTKNNSQRGKETFWQRLRDMFSQKIENDVQQFLLKKQNNLVH